MEEQDKDLKVVAADEEEIKSGDRRGGGTENFHNKPCRIISWFKLHAYQY